MDRNYGRNLTKEYLRMLPAGTTIRKATKRKTIEASAVTNRMLAREKNLVRIVKGCLCTAITGYQNFCGTMSAPVSKSKKYL